MRDADVAAARCHLTNRRRLRRLCSSRRPEIHAALADNENLSPALFSRLFGNPAFRLTVRIASAILANPSATPDSLRVVAECPRSLFGCREAARAILAAYLAK